MVMGKPQCEHSLPIMHFRFHFVSFLCFNFVFLGPEIDLGSKVVEPSSA